MIMYLSRGLFKKKYMKKFKIKIYLGSNIFF